MTNTFPDNPLLLIRFLWLNDIPDSLASYIQSIIDIHISEQEWHIESHLGKCQSIPFGSTKNPVKPYLYLCL